MISKQKSSILAAKALMFLNAISLRRRLQQRPKTFLVAITLFSS